MNIEDTKLIQDLISVLAPEVDSSPWATIQPLGIRWLSRMSVTQLVAAVSHSEHMYKENGKLRNRKRKADHIENIDNIENINN